MKIVKINGLKIGSGIPKICVPIIAKNLKEAVKQAEKIMHVPADIVEIRGDFFSEISNKKKLHILLTKLSATLPEKIILFTYRSKSQGGVGTFNICQYEAICKRAIDSGCIHMLDIEISLPFEVVRNLTIYAQSKGIAVVSSYHNFFKTPTFSNLVNIIKKMRRSGANIAKIAAMPNSALDILTIQKLGLEEVKRVDAIPFIGISLGKMGISSRINCELFNSAISFGTIGKNSAPGQIDVNSLDSFLMDIHREIMDKKYKKRKNAFKTNKTNKRNIVLIGFMGTGKTNVAKNLGKLLDMEVKDIDKMIEKICGMRVHKIFENKGESYFRKIEREQVKKLATMDNIIIASGGGTVMLRENVDALKQNGVMIMLRAKPDFIYSRVKHSKNRRPLLTRYMSPGYISWLMKKREDVYTKISDLIINVDGKTSSNVAFELARLLKEDKTVLDPK